jgi:2-oxoisovalerate dehydrogenase E1 component
MTSWSEQQPSAEDERYQILSADGVLQRDLPSLSDDELLDLYRTFIQTRTFEEKTYNMQRRGEISIEARCVGEEATPLGSAAALKPGDWCFPSYRQTPALLHWNGRMDRILANLMGAEPETVDEHLPAGDGPAVNFTPAYIPLAVNITNAVGSGMADTFGDENAVSLAYIGDGSTSEGDFHEALNFAGVFDASTVVVCQNNQWAISVPAHRQTAADTFARKAEAHGVPHERVDGNDVLAVYERTREAVERARQDGGPTFIECVTYRMVEHNTADDPSVYRDEELQEYWAERDPVDRFEAYLRGQGLLDDDRIATIQSKTEERVQEHVETARELAESDPQRMFDNHLHGESWRERRQRQELAREQERTNPFAATVDKDLKPANNPDARTGEEIVDTTESTEHTLVQAVNEGLRGEMKRDDSVRLLGYDIGPIGGVYRATNGLFEEFGGNRVIDTPLSENAILGSAVGMAMRGQRIIPEIQFMGFFYPAFGQFMYTLVKMCERSGGDLKTPVTVRVPYGGDIQASEYHSESTESFLVHTPGVRVICPSTPAETKGLLAASIRSDDPVVFMESKKLYREVTGPVPDTEYTLPLDKARLVQEGTDVTVLTYGAMVRHAIEAADRVDADVEILDLRTLSPLDIDAILASVKRTGRCVVFHEARRTLGLGAELSALVNEHALHYMKAPTVRATGYDVHYPGHQLEDAYMPDPNRAEYAIKTVLNSAF